MDDFWDENPTQYTNGVIEVNHEILTNVIAIAARGSVGLALKRDGTVVAFGRGYYGRTPPVPADLSNVVSIAMEGNYCWAIKRDRTLTWWATDSNDGGTVAGLSNVVSIASAGFGNYFALKNDGSVQEFSLENVAPSIIDPATGLPVEYYHGAFPARPVLGDIVALASMGESILFLQKDGRVLRLHSPSPIPGPPYEYDPTDFIAVDGATLSNVVAIAGGFQHALALKSDGKIVAWGDNSTGECTVPPGLSNVVAIAAWPGLSLALKRDGTVAAWGDNTFGRASVPAGLSNVVAIVAGWQFCLALTTGEIPSSVHITPHGRLEEMLPESDIIFKGRIISTLAVTNQLFPYWAKTHMTKFEIISVLKGKLDANQISFWHVTEGPGSWSGGATPSWHHFQPGQCYLVFGARLDKPQYLFTVPPDAAGRSNEFRQLYRDGVLRTLDDRPVDGLSVKEAHWFELNLALKDTNPTNVLYAIENLDKMSLAGRHDDQWTRSDDFKRENVLRALLPLATSGNEQITKCAINCFAVETNAATGLQPFVGDLTKVANESPFSSCRLSAIYALSGVNGDAVSNSLAQLLKDRDKDIRVGAVRLVPRFSKDFAVQALRERAEDESADVRSVVADLIGDGKFARVLPTLVKLFADPVGKDPLIKPLTMKFLRSGRRWNNIGDVHTSAGMALVKFDPDQVADILKANLDDPGFHINFVSKLAEADPATWLPELAEILETRLKSVDEFLRLPPGDSRKYEDTTEDRILIGAYARCWEDIRQFLLKASAEKLSGGELDRFMDLLEKTVRPIPGCPGCGVDEAERLYELYRIKGLERRAGEIRRRFNQTDGWRFDEFDKKH